MTNRFLLYIYVFFWSIALYPNGAILGKIEDEKSKKPLEYVAVFLFDAKENMIANTKTSTSGTFELKNIPDGSYTLKCKYLGYQLYTSSIIQINNTDKSLGIIKMKDIQKQVKNVLITAEKSSKASNIDKKVYSPSQLLNSQNSSAAELINSLPSVNMGNDANNVSVRGDENVTILINGKMSTLTGDNLGQIPSSAIERIEVITNPNSKMNSEGSGGVINIVMKQANANLTSGYVSGSVGTNNKYNTQAGYNFALNKFSFSTAYSYKYEEYLNWGYSHRSYLNNGETNYFDQNTTGETYKRNHFGRIGVQYDIDKYNVLSCIGSISNTWNNSYELKKNQTEDNTRLATSIWNRNGYKTDLNLIYDASLSYTHSIPNSSNKFSIELSHNANNNNLNEKFVMPYSLINSVSRDTTAYSMIPNEQRRTTTTAQIDYTMGINSNNTLETGLRGAIRDFRFSNYYYTMSSWQGSDLTVYSPLTNDFNFVEKVYSAYGVLTSTLSEKLTSKIGFRAEQTNTNSTNFDTIPLYQNNYFNFFPSAFLNYKLAPNQGNITLSYSKRINRPGPGMLNPIQDVTDPQSLRFGNPKLNPEIVNSYELGYGNDIGKKLSFSTTGYYKHAINSITRYISINDLGATQVLIDNIGSLNNIGWEIISNYKASNSLSFNFNSNLSYNSLEYQAQSKLYQNTYISWQGRWITNIKLPYNFDFQSIIFYKTPFKTPQGTVDFMSNFDLTLRKKILNQKGLITLGITDILNDQKFKIAIDETNFNSAFYRKKETRILTLGFRYNFGGESIKKPKIEKVEIPKETQDGGF